MELNMSEVNQAFLRAYLKNRTAQNPQSSIEPTGTANTETMSPNPSPVRPAANVLKQPAAASVTRTTAAGNHLRVDSSHTQANSNRRNDSYQSPLPSPTPAHSEFANVPVAPSVPRQGVWSPIGVERGMKAMESMSVPAVVRNGVASVTSQAAQTRSPLAPQHARREDPAPSNLSYDQVVYVDGLQDHAVVARKPAIQNTQQTIAEITEPIAFGTGTSVPTPNAKRSHEVARHAETPRTEPPRTEQHRFQSPTSTRFDAPHTQRNDRPVISSPPIEPVLAKPPAPQVAVPFTPSWEVDLFYWPEVVKQIEASHADAFSQIGKHLKLANRDGLKVMSITSGERGVGRSTVAMHMARCAAAAGLRVALVDGDTFCPSLVDQLRLDMEHGWQDCLFENVPLQEAAIHSISDGITLFPLTSVVSHHQLHANLLRISKLIKRISNAFDMVFIDANRLNLEQRDMVGVSQETIVDAAIVVVDTELSIKEKIDSAVSILQSMGLSSVGLVENFQS
jgi:Mrp family chromosome partitioning ATPase